MYNYRKTAGCLLHSGADPRFHEDPSAHRNLNTFPIRPKGRCMIPPDGRIWFHTYNPMRDGPLVPCRYPTAAY